MELPQLQRRGQAVKHTREAQGAHALAPLAHLVSILGIYLGDLWSRLQDWRIVFFFAGPFFVVFYDAKSSIACSRSASAMQKPSYPVPLVTKLCSRWPLGCKKRGQFQPGLKTHCCCHSQYGTTRDYILYINTSYIYIYGTIGCTKYNVYIIYTYL